MSHNLESIPHVQTQEYASINDRFVAHMLSVLGSGFAVDEIRSLIKNGEFAIDFAFSNLNRERIGSPFGESFFDENETQTERGSIDGDSVCIVTVNDLYFVLDIHRGCPDKTESTSDAYLNGIAYVFSDKIKARAWAVRLTAEVRKKHCTKLARRMMAIAGVMPPQTVAQILIEALQMTYGSASEFEAVTWRERMLWFLMHQAPVHTVEST